MKTIEVAINDCIEKVADTSLFDLNELQLALVGGGNADISLN
jgi:hypothetical protein